MANHAAGGAEGRPGRGRWVATVGELAEAEGLTAEQALAVLRLYLSAVAVEQLARGLALPEGPAEGMPVTVWVPLLRCRSG